MPDTIQAVTRFPLDSSWDSGATPFLMSPYMLSTRHQRFACAHLHISYLTGSCPAFSVTLTTLTLNQRSSRWFGNYSWKSLPEGHPPSFLQLRANPSCSRGTPEPPHVFNKITGRFDVVRSPNNLSGISPGRLNRSTITL